MNEFVAIPMPETLAELPHPPGESLLVGDAWSNHPVGFSLLTSGTRQLAAYYNGEGWMTVAGRDLDSADWHLVRLPERIGWDSHNYVVIAADSEGCLHLSGNMHGDPLVYFRTRTPHDIGSFERVSALTGDRENQVTYPNFFAGPGGALCFSYRDGSSGRGDQIYDCYDAQSRKWKRLSDGPLVIGEGVRNAYLHGPRCGADGKYHLCWVWRDSPEADTNHHVCYARSADLIHWETSTGEPLEVPIRHAKCEVVDPVPTGRGLMNGNVVLGFSANGAPVISYNKLDERGNSQVYSARPTSRGWDIRQVSNWEGAWIATGLGSLRYDIRVHPVVLGADGRLTQRYYHHRYGAGKWLIDEASLLPTGHLLSASDGMKNWQAPSEQGLRVNWSRDRTKGLDNLYALRWESLPENGDLPRDEVREPCELRVAALGPEDG